MNKLKWKNWKEWMTKNAQTQDFSLKSSSRYNPVHVLSTLSFKSSLRPSFFHEFLWSITWWRCGWHMNSSSRYSLVRILSTSSSKSGLNRSVFCDSYSLVHILSTTCPDRGKQPRKQRPSSGDHGRPLGFRARECFQAWIHVFPIAHTSQLLDDDAVDMMMWLTWWCGWHDDVN